jgi:hypothetical protein
MAVRAARVLSAAMAFSLLAGTAVAQNRGGGSLACHAVIARAALRYGEACNLPVPDAAAERLHRVQEAYLAAEARLHGETVRNEMDRGVTSSSRPPSSERGCATYRSFMEQMIGNFSGEQGERFTRMLEDEAQVTTDPRAGYCL